MIEVHDVRKSYGTVEAVKGVSFSVDSNEIVGLLGPNGAGKTTIMKILTCYHFPSSGSAEVAGLDVYQDSLEIKRRIGYLPETAPVYPELNVMEYLNFIADSREIPSTEKADRIDHAIEQCGLEKMVYRSIDNLSKGYRQRTGLAQAIVHDPDILILDEPTSGLDPNQILDIRALITELGKKKTVILSTHIMQEVEAVCGRVLILNEGRIAAEGTPEEITSELQGEDLFTLTLKGAESAAAHKALQGLDGVSSVTDVVTIGGDVCSLRLSMSAGDGYENGERIFDWAVKSGYKLVDMHRTRYSLEDIFTKLTKGPKENV